MLLALSINPYAPKQSSLCIYHAHICACSAAADADADNVWTDSSTGIFMLLPRPLLPLLSMMSVLDSFKPLNHGSDCHSFCDLPGLDVRLILQAAIAQYLGSCCRHGITMPAGLHLLAIDVALLRGHSHQVSLTLLP